MTYDINPGTNHGHAEKADPDDIIEWFRKDDATPKTMLERGEMPWAPL